MYDLLLKNGVYPDFYKEEMRKGNIAAEKGKIVYIGEGEPAVTVSAVRSVFLPALL